MKKNNTLLLIVICIVVVLFGFLFYKDKEEIKTIKSEKQLESCREFLG